LPLTLSPMLVLLVVVCQIVAPRSYASTSLPVYRDMLEQAVLLFRLATEIDRDYLLQRIVEEGGDPGQLDLERE